MSDDPELTCLLRAQRILVLGSPGSGKTYLSDFLSRRLELELLPLDDFFWKPGPVRTPEAEWRVLMASLARRPSWIMDGTYEASLDLRIPEADVIIFIQSNRWACLWRVIARRMKSLWRGNQEQAYVQEITPFFLGYIFRFPRLPQAEVFHQIALDGPNKPLIILQGANGVSRFIQRLERDSCNVIISEDNAPGDSTPVEARPNDIS